MQPPSCPSLARFRYLPMGSPMSSYQAVKKAYFLPGWRLPAAPKPGSLGDTPVPRSGPSTSHRMQANASPLCAPLLFSFCSPLGPGLPPIQRSQSPWHARMLCRSSGPNGCFILWRWLLRRRSCRELGDRLPAVLPRVAEWGTKVINM